MTTFDLTAIRQGLGANLAAVFQDSYHVMSYMRGAATPPSMQVFPDHRNLHEELDDGSTAFMVVKLLVGGADDVTAQDNLDQLLGDGALSVSKALEADGQLTSRLDQSGNLYRDQPAAASDVTVTEWDGYRLYGPNNTILGALLMVEVKT